jgi:dUTP pyrophosphatase
MQQHPWQLNQYIYAESEELLPERAHTTDSGFDLFANISEPVELVAGERFTVPTGVYLDLPSHDGVQILEAQIRSKSGLARQHGVIVLNSPATIDNGYTGEIQVILHNTDICQSYLIEPLSKIAQLVFCYLPVIGYLNANRDQPNRGDRGFGSTGTHRKG